MNNCYNEFLVEAAVQINSRKQSAEVILLKNFFKNSQNPYENTCVEIFFNKVAGKFSQELFSEMHVSGCFCILRIKCYEKVSNIFQENNCKDYGNRYFPMNFIIFLDQLSFRIQGYCFYKKATGNGYSYLLFNA